VGGVTGEVAVELLVCATTKGIAALAGAGVGLSPPPARKRNTELTNNIFFMVLVQEEGTSTDGSNHILASENFGVSDSQNKEV
jgi:hypothetical protein